MIHRSLYYICIIFSVFAQYTLCLYSSKSNVIQLTDKNFYDEVINSNNIYFVEFYANWCGHCKALAPEYDKLATTYNNIIKIGAIDADTYRSISSQYNIQGFPTLKLFLPNKKQPIDYNGERNVNGMSQFLLQSLNQVVQQRLTGKAGSNNKTKKNKSKNKSNENKSSNGKVIELNNNNFADEVIHTDQVTLVEFYAPWCGHCKALAPEYKKAAKELGGIAKLTAIDATVYTDIAQKYQIKGYPTLKVFKPGNNGNKYDDYNGGRTSNDIIQYMKNIASSYIPAKPVQQLINNDSFNKECNDVSICYIAFLPPLYDTTLKERNNQIDILNKMSNKYKSQSFSFLWSEGLSQSKLEQLLDIQAGNYPTLVAINMKKQRSSIHLGAFSDTAVNEFIKRIVNGKIDNYRQFDNNDIVITNVDKWNGKDIDRSVKSTSDEYDIDLSDITGSGTNTDEL